jgi:hypothetical protein
MALCDPDGPWNYAPKLSLDDLEDWLDVIDWEAMT